MAQPSLSAATAGQGTGTTGGTPATLSHTVGAGVSHLLAIVGINGNPAYDACSWNGNAMTEIGPGQNYSNVTALRFFVLAAPAAATANFSYTPTNSISGHGFLLFNVTHGNPTSFTGTAQGNNTVGGGTGNETIGPFSITDNDILLGALVDQNTADVDVADGATQLNDGFMSSTKPASFAMTKTGNGSINLTIDYPTGGPEGVFYGVPLFGDTSSASLAWIQG